MDELLSAWGVQGARLSPVDEGTNNTNVYVGDEFVLRVHRNTVTPDYEHAVLRALGGLSFDVPVPVVTRDGTTVARGVLDGNVVTASLSRRIAGEHPRRGDLVQAEACGNTLAELDLEFVCLGYRAMDLAVGLWFFGADGPAAEAFQRGYLARCELTSTELAALPDLQLLREATSLVHWYGRCLDGLTSAADVVERADRLLRLAVRS